MAKIGTAHVEIKPVVSDEALDDLMQRIADAVAEGVRRGMAQPMTVHLDGRQIARVVEEQHRRKDTP